MNTEKVQRVADLAEQVLKLARAYILAEAPLDEAFASKAGPPYPPGAGPALTGELRRRSMDLTRALAEMRRPG